jgi:hypothetical protein
MSHIQDNDKNSLKTTLKGEAFVITKISTFLNFGWVFTKVKKKDNLGKTLLKDSYKFEPEMWKR